MGSIGYNLQFDMLCKECGLGDLVKSPKPLFGGHMHKMFGLETTTGKYAVKAINPNIIARPAAMGNYLISERVATIASTYVPALPAKVIGDRAMQEIDGQSYLVFDWVDGECLLNDRTNETHCREIGQILAGIHSIDFASKGLATTSDSATDIDINFVSYLRMGREKDRPWVSLLEQNIKNLQKFSLAANEASKSLASQVVMSHRDLEPKNVLWCGESPVIIDWESAGPINPYHDMFETALYWSNDAYRNICNEKFASFIWGYQSKIALDNINWAPIFDIGYAAKLGWLEYSLKRSLGLESADEAEMEMGTSHVPATIRAILRYSDLISLCSVFYTRFLAIISV